MFVRRVAGILALAFGLLPTITDVSASLAAREPISRTPIVRRAPIMSVAERLKAPTVSHHPTKPTAALVPHALADLSSPVRSTFVFPRGTGATLHPQTFVPHAPKLPASNRIRAPSV